MLILVPVAVIVGVYVKVNVGVDVGSRIWVGPNANKALTVNAAAVFNPLISGSFVANDLISAAVGGVGSKNAIA